MRVVTQNTDSSSGTVETLVNTVIKGGYCIGCGVCSIPDQSPFEIVMNDVGQFQARLRPQKQSGDSLRYPITSVCPFADGNPNEDAIAQALNLNSGVYTNGIGYALATFAGFVVEGDYREKGSSGGIVTWLLSSLLEEGLVDAVIHVREASGIDIDSDTPMFRMEISRTVEEVRSGAKSRYYPVEMSGVLREVMAKPGIYALVGVPCFVKAVRLLAFQEEVIRERIRYCISLVCGHLKSENFARMLAWDAGIFPAELRSLDFRYKLLNRPANRYAVKFVTRSNEKKVIPIDDLYGYNWGFGFFKYEACDYCDDIVGETADISIGDAWLPQYVDDPLGTNILVVRNESILRLLRRAVEAGRLQLIPISPRDVVASQDAGIRHRRQGLAYRLYLKQQRGEWVPTKRVQPSKDHLTERERKIQHLRIELRNASHKAFVAAMQKGNWSLFRGTMDPLIAQYRQLYRDSIIKRVRRRLARMLARALRR